MTSEVELMQYRPAVLHSVKALKGKGIHGDPSYYDICKYLGFIGSDIYDSHQIAIVVDCLHDLESKGIIEGSGGYYITGTHSGAGSKKWTVKR